jgi:hypothetical protein
VHVGNGHPNAPTSTSASILVYLLAFCESCPHMLLITMRVIKEC